MRIDSPFQAPEDATNAPMHERLARQEAEALAPLRERLEREEELQGTINALWNGILFIVGVLIICGAAWLLGSSR